MISSIIYNRGKWLLRIFSLCFLCAIAYIAYKVPLPVLPVKEQKEKAPFSQARHFVRKQLITRSNSGSYVTTIYSPFTLLSTDSHGLLETLYDMKGSSIEASKETRFFEAKEAVFSYATLDLTAPNMHFVFEKGEKKVPDTPYYTGNGDHIHMDFFDGTPRITAEKIEGIGDVPFFFGEKKDAS